MIRALSNTKPNLPPLTLNATLRWDVVSRVLGGLGPLGRIVEVGSGQGGAAARLASRANSYAGYEPDMTSFEIASQRIEPFSSARVINGYLPEIVEQPADLVCAFEVLEHIEFDTDALNDWAKWVKPGGHILISVPANEKRYGPADRAVGHYRRYSREGLQKKIESAGFEDVHVLGYGMPLGYLLEAVRNRMLRGSDGTPEERSSISGRVLQPAIWMRYFIRLGTYPFRLMQRPFVNSNLATGWVAVGRRVQ